MPALVDGLIHMPHTAAVHELDNLKATLQNETGLERAIIGGLDVSAQLRIDDLQVTWVRGPIIIEPPFQDL